jgi:hypothetical protein
MGVACCLAGLALVVALLLAYELGGDRLDEQTVTPVVLSRGLNQSAG